MKGLWTILRLNPKPAKRYQGSLSHHLRDCLKCTFCGSLNPIYDFWCFYNLMLQDSKMYNLQPTWLYLLSAYCVKYQCRDCYSVIHLHDVSEGVLDVCLDGRVVADELQVAHVIEVDVWTVGHQRRELLLDRSLEEQDLAVARVLHQALDEVRHLL